MCWDENSDSWCVWGKNRQEKTFFGYFGEGELETTDLESGDGDALLSVSPLVRFLEHRFWGFTYVWRS
jgi:hypothetical protein